MANAFGALVFFVPFVAKTFVPFVAVLWTISERLRRILCFLCLLWLKTFVPFVAVLLEVELRYELYFTCRAGSVPQDLTERATRQDQVCIRHCERRRVGYVLRLNTNLEVSTLIK